MYCLLHNVHDGIGNTYSLCGRCIAFFIMYMMALVTRIHCVADVLMIFANHHIAVLLLLLSLINPIYITYLLCAIMSMHVHALWACTSTHYEHARPRIMSMHVHALWACTSTHYEHARPRIMSMHVHALWACTSTHYEHARPRIQKSTW